MSTEGSSCINNMIEYLSRVDLLALCDLHEAVSIVPIPSAAAWGMFDSLRTNLGWCSPDQWNEETDTQLLPARILASWLADGTLTVSNKVCRGPRNSYRTYHTASSVCDQTR
jgi:hypothetical protein